MLHLSLLVVNFCSIKLKNKQAELQAFLVVHLNIIIGTESHLDGSVLNSEIFPSHYQVYRKTETSIVEVFFILVDNSIPSSQVMIDSLCECLGVGS